MSRSTVLRVVTLIMVVALGLVPVASALAAAPQQDVNPDIVGLWVSEESTEGETVSLSLFDDGAMQGLSEFADGADNVLYSGEWADNGDDTVSILIVEVDGLAIGDEPFEIVFDVVSADELNAADTTDFGDDGMSIFFEDSEPLAFVDEAGDVAADVTDSEVLTDTETLADTEEMVEAVAPGVYVSNGLEDNGIPVAALVYINEDGTYQSVVATFDAESNTITQLGVWEDDGEGTLTLSSEQEMTVTADGAEFADLDEPLDLEFAITADVLEGDVLRLFPLSAVEEVLSGFAGMVDDEMGADEAGAAESFDTMLYMSPMKDILAGTIQVLVLVSDGTASFTSGTTDDAEAVVEVGAWEEDSDGVITVELTQDDAGADLDEPSTIVFELDEDGNLVATDFDTDRYGDSIVLELTDDQ